MPPIGQSERVPQNRVLSLVRDKLSYRHLDDWTDRDGNSNVEECLLTNDLTRAGYTPPQISIVLHKLRTEADHLVNWHAPAKNDFAIAVLELKNSRVSIGDGIRHLTR